MTTKSTDAAGAGGQDEQVDVRSGTVLRARREDIELQTADGLTLVGELALPPDHDPVATLVTLHPLPTHGGFMDSHVLRKASYRLPALADIAVLRFNTRGTTSPRGTSEGTFDEARSERFDVAAAIEFAEFHDLPRRWLLGWSFGTDLALMHGHDPAVEGAILLSPPLRFSGPEHLQAWADGGKPLVALVPEHDDYLRPTEAARRFAVVPQARVVGIEGGRHLWVGETLVRRALDEIVAVVAPDRGPLPHTVPASMVEPDVADTTDAIDPAGTDSAGADPADSAGTDSAGPDPDAAGPDPAAAETARG